MLAMSDMDPIIDIDGFGVPVRLDRDPCTMGKRQGGGVWFYINPRWSNNVTVREKICLPDIELLTILVRPYYLPREFPQVFLLVVYIHPKANTTNANEVFSVLQRLQSISPDAPCLVVGDFNHSNCNKTLSHFHLYITCHTRGSKTLDLL